MYHTSIARKAFTLLELMIAFVIMAILSAVAVPSLLNVVNGDQQTGDNASAIAATSAYTDSQFAAGQYGAPTGTVAAAGITAAGLPSGVTVAPGAATNSVLFTYPHDTVCVDLQSGGATPTLGSDCGSSGGGSGSTTTSLALASWQTAIEVPGTGAMNVGDYAQVTAISCSSAGNCSAGGIYATGANFLTEPFVVNEISGVWQTAIEVPGIATLNTGNNANLTSLSCSSAGNCAAAGSYTSSTGLQAFVVSETNGVWGSAIEVAGALNVNGYGEAFGVSCTSNGNCAAGGQYEDASYLNQAFVIDETNGTWGTAIEVPGIGALNVKGQASVDSISCSSPGNCAASGTYLGASFHGEAFVVSETNGVWGSATTVASSLNVGNNAVSGTISCSSAGNCAAGGLYADAAGKMQAFVVDGSSGTWGSAIEVPGTATLNAGGSANVGSVSCSSAGNCAAVGSYTDAAGKTQAFVVDESSGTWGSAIEAPGTAALNAGNASVYSVSCTSAGTCAAAGQYSDSSGISQAFVINESGGTWGTAIEVPGTSSLNAGGSGNSALSISCNSANSCVAGGNFSDGTSSNKLQAFVANYS